MIVILLVVIIFILAPWLISVVVAMAAIYGVWVMFIAAIAAALLVLLGIFFTVRALFFPKKTAGDLLAVKNKEFNRRYMEQAAAERRLREQEETDRDEGNGSTDERDAVVIPATAAHSPRMISCPHCTESIPKYGLWCPACGKDPKLI